MLPHTFEDWRSRPTYLFFRRFLSAAAALLFGLAPRDPVSLVAAMALMAIALIASYGPARRAAAIANRWRRCGMSDER